MGLQKSLQALIFPIILLWLSGHFFLLKITRVSFLWIIFMVIKMRKLF